MPRVSVVMSVYNGATYLAESVDSILNQTFTDFEFIIINDGSTDETSAILQSYSENDSRIKLICQKNIGLTKSLNKGLKLAAGNYIARMDADDISLPERFEKQVSFLDANPDIGILGINCQIIDNNNNIISHLHRPLIHKQIIAELLVENRFVHSSIMLRKSLFEKVGYYNENLAIAQDYELFLRCINSTQCANLFDSLHKWRYNKVDGISVVKRDKQIIARDNIRREFLKKHYCLEKHYINLLLSNYKNKPNDTVLAESLSKLLNDLSFFAELQMKLQLFIIALPNTTVKLKALIMSKINIRQRIQKYKHNYDRNKRIAAFKLIDHPSSLIFLMKNTCNSRCIMCGLNYADNSTVSEMTLDKYKKMLNNVDMNKVTEITFSGGGEPLLCTDILSIAKYTRDEYPKMKLGLYTNGIVLSESVAQEFVGLGFSKMTISINASSIETYKEIMGVDSFDKVVSNIKQLIDARNKAGSNMFVQLSFVASRLNIDDLPGLVTLGAELGVNEVSMQYCRFYSKKLKMDDNTSQSKMDRKLSLFYHQAHSDKMTRKALELEKVNKIQFIHEPLFDAPMQLPTECSWPWRAIFIGTEGEIYPCGGGEVMFYESVKSKKLHFGNLLRENIVEFWNNEDYRKIRESSQCDCKNKSILQCYSCNHTIYWEGMKSEKSHFIDTL